MILFEDKDIIVCHKPAGIPVQSARLGQKDMVSILNNHLAGQQEKMTDFVHVVHRLDQPVEGVMVFAKNQKAAANLTKQIQENRVQKVYQAVCCDVDKSTESEKSGEDCGKLPKKTGVMGKNIPEAPDGKSGQRDAKENTDGRDMLKIHLEDYLVKDGRTNTSRIARKGEKDAKQAVLEYEVLGTKADYKLVQVYLKTGRHHQIRVQMAHANLPLYGDQKYNKRWTEFLLTGRAKTGSGETDAVNGADNFADEQRDRKPGLALCAVSFSFKHPVTGKKMKFEVKPENPVFGVFER